MKLELWSNFFGNTLISGGHDKKTFAPTVFITVTGEPYERLEQITLLLRQCVRFTVPLINCDCCF